MNCRSSLGLVISLFMGSLTAADAERAVSAEVELNGYRFHLADGLEIERVAATPLVNRPICADFDEQGRLYVADSSGSNEDVHAQLENPTHRIVRLEDTNGDGTFDESVVFADQMMFPEGALWYDGSLYVGAPPHIWKLTDTDDDGVADQRTAWFDGKTLTHCGNDMHGPYLGLDGWFYWCKGAFAEQTYQRQGGEALVTRAAHIFRRHPAGGEIEPVMTGGMDNPVEVVFTPGGERIFTTTFLVHPAHGQRDGIIHAIYGGVYGKVHHVLDGHPRTGPIMPVLSHHGGASAPCGFLRLETDQLGSEYQGNLLACSFNMHKVFRHVLAPDGASFRTEDSDFLSCDHLDFHPTDVLEDADGSLLVVDTGGWYKMCCPTSQLAKPDILGGIYRIRRTGSHQGDDPRGTRIDWAKSTTSELSEMLGDGRFVVRSRVREALSRHGAPAVDALRGVLSHSPDSSRRLQAVWTLTRIEQAEARAAVRAALDDPDATVRQAALHSVSLHRDGQAHQRLIDMLGTAPLANQRAAAEALGRIGSDETVSALLAATADCTDRALEHSLIYAVIELNRPEPTRVAISDKRPRVQRAALIALDQMPGGNVTVSEITAFLESSNPILSESAWWITERHPEFAKHLTVFFSRTLSATAMPETSPLAKRLARFAAEDSIQQMMAERLASPELNRAGRIAIMQAMKGCELSEMPTSWCGPLGAQLRRDDVELQELAVSAVHALAGPQLDDVLLPPLRTVARNVDLPAHIRLQALSAIPVQQRELDDKMLAFVCTGLSADQSVAIRSLSVDVLSEMTLDAQQLEQVAAAVATTGPMELPRLLEVFSKTANEQVGQTLVEALSRCPSVTSLSEEKLTKELSLLGDAVVRGAAPLFRRIRQDNAERFARLEEILQLVDGGDVRRGQQVFHSTQAACISCHEMGYLGGQVGPDLTRIGTIRSERDLLESILFPNYSFVQSFEPTQIITFDGQVYSGVVRDETATEVVLQLDAVKFIRIARDNIEERQPGTVSVMPSGLEKNFDPQQVADLVMFLKATK